MNDKQLDMVLGYLNEGTEIDKEEFFKAKESYINEAAWKAKLYDQEKNDEKTVNYYNKIKKDKGFIEKEVNRVSKESFAQYKVKIENMKPSTKYQESDKQYALKFCSGKAPKVKYFGRETDYVEIQMTYDKGEHDDMLFFQDFLVDNLNKDEKLKAKGYRFTSDDYLAIYIQLR